MAASAALGFDEGSDGCMLVVVVLDVFGVSSSFGKDDDHHTI